jgi:hypothetical protein
MEGGILEFMDGDCVNNKGKGARGAFSLSYASQTQNLEPKRYKQVIPFIEGARGLRLRTLVAA